MIRSKEQNNELSRASTERESEIAALRRGMQVYNTWQFMCLDMCADMCADMCVDTCADMCADMTAEAWACRCWSSSGQSCSRRRRGSQVCIDVRMDKRTDMRIDMCVYICVDMCIVTDRRFRCGAARAGSGDGEGAITYGRQAD